MNKVLVLIDIQNDYFPGGSMELTGMESAANNAAKVLQFFRENNTPVIHIQHLSIRPGSTFFIPETTGALIHQSVLPLKSETVINKHFPNSFRDTMLFQNLKDLRIEQIVFCGAMSHMCIDTTIRAAFDLGFKCQVVTDACATKDLYFAGVKIEAEKVHAAFMAALSPLFAQAVETANVISSS